MNRDVSRPLKFFSITNAQRAGHLTRHIAEAIGSAESRAYSVNDKQEGRDK